MARFYQGQALEEIREEHSQYFDALEKHPRLLVGEEVPSIGREGSEVLRDTADATEWQEAVKSIMVDEVRSRASKALDEQGDFLTTLHASIELFQNNTDLIPGTAEFDVELANRFTTLATPYELRVEDKLQGYSIPVQPLVDNLRAQIARERAAAPPLPPSPVSTSRTPTEPVASSQPVPDPPQAGIPSKAGNGTHEEDFSVLFGTIGLPNLQI